jgi:hypothetical protein
MKNENEIENLKTDVTGEYGVHFYWVSAFLVCAIVLSFTDLLFLYRTP